MSEKDIIETHLRPRDYYRGEVCRIINQKQMRLYVKNNVYPIDMYLSIDDNNNDIMVYIFLKEETKDLFQAWLAHELE